MSASLPSFRLSNDWHIARSANTSLFCSAAVEMTPSSPPFLLPPSLPLCSLHCRVLVFCLAFLHSLSLSLFFFALQFFGLQSSSSNYVFIFNNRRGGGGGGESRRRRCCCFFPSLSYYPGVLFSVLVCVIIFLEAFFFSLSDTGAAAVAVVVSDNISSN